MEHWKGLHEILRKDFERVVAEKNVLAGDFVVLRDKSEAEIKGLREKLAAVGQEGSGLAGRLLAAVHGLLHAHQTTAMGLQGHLSAIGEVKAALPEDQHGLLTQVVDTALAKSNAVATAKEPTQPVVHSGVV